MLERLTQLLWGRPMLWFMTLLGLRITWLTRGYPLRCFGRMWRLTLGKKPDGAGGPSPWQTLCTALGGTIGVGNTVGVAAAIAVGGPGAVLWMVLSAFLAAGIKFAETYLAGLCKDPALGFGGPMHYMRHLLGSRPLALFFSLSVLPASLFVGNLAQSNLVCLSARQIFGLPAPAMGLVLAVAMGAVLLGGAKRIGQLCAVLVPWMSVGYLALCLIILLQNAGQVPRALASIWQGAWAPLALPGGVGAHLLSRALSAGFSKGMFSNEAGMGSAPMAHTRSRETDPQALGAWGVWEVLIDTVLICTLTALVILTAGPEVADPVQAVLGCFTQSFGKPGQWFFFASMTLFAFASMCAWSLYATSALSTLSPRPRYRYLFTALFVVAIPLGAGLSTGRILLWADLFNALMALPNLLALWLLSHRKDLCAQWRRL